MNPYSFGPGRLWVNIFPVRSRQYFSRFVGSQLYFLPGLTPVNLIHTLDEKR